MERRWQRRDAIAVETEVGQMSYADLAERVRRACGWLRNRGLRAGDVVVLALPRSAELLELHLAALASGVAVVPTNHRYTAAELGYAIADSGAALACVSDGLKLTAAVATARAADLRAELDHTAPFDPDEPADDAIAAICYTSGTTGSPKGALLTHTNLAGTVLGLHEAWRWRADDVLVHALPLFHIHGLFVAQYGALWAGARTIWMDRFEPAEALALLAERGTVFMGVPTFYERFAALPASARFDLSRVRLFTCGSAGLPARLFETFQARFGHRVLERYGMTECGIVLSNPYDDRRPGAVGVPLPGVEAHVADPDTDAPVADEVVGELRIRSLGLFQGYRSAPEKTAAAMAGGFLRTGDLARRDADGFFHIVGRIDDMLISGGFNVYPTEIEAALLEHPEVAEVAVVGAPDADLGERPVASVVQRQGSAATVDVLLAFAAERLAAYKVPRAIELAPELPRNAMGKVVRAELKLRWSQVRVRPARSDDAPRLAEGNVRMAEETEGVALDPSVALRGARAPFERDVGAVYFVAEIAGGWAGQCMVTTEWSDWRDRPVWWLQSVHVIPAFRGRGVYRALHEEVVARARAASAAGVRLYVDTRNTRAMEVYRRVGMTGGHYAVFEHMFDPADGGYAPPGEDR